MSRPNETTEEWTKSVAAFAVDALLDAGLVQREHFDVARDIVAEELYVWLCMEHYPPPMRNRNEAGGSTDAT
jgi:hypothetical protein